MNDLIMFITNGATEFTPEVMVRLIVFCIMFDGLMMSISAMFKGVVHK